MSVATVEPEIERLDKLQLYFDYHNTGKRYGISFNDFVRKVDEGSWQQFLDDHMILPQHVRELCYSQ